MLLSATSPAQVAALYCVPWNPNDPMLPIYDQLSNQFNTDNDPSFKALLMVALQNQIMLYRKGGCTDCATQGLPPTQTVINPPTNSGTATPVGVVQTNTTDAAIGQAVGLGSQAASTLASVLGATKSLPIIGAISSVIADVVGIFTQAHAAAVAKEQAVNCAVAFAFNKYIPVYDAAVAAGNMSAATALANVTQLIQSQLIPALAPVTSAHNWGWSAGQALQCHLAFRQQWYLQLEQAGNSVFGGGASGIVASVEANPLILVAIAVGTALLLRPSRAAT